MAEVELGAAVCVIEVVAGLLPERPERTYTRRWSVDSIEWEAAGDDGRMALLLDRNTAALAYAAGLMARPENLNWVRVDWVWM